VRIFIGWDGREVEAFNVAAKTARRFGHEVIAVHEDRLRAAGLMTRPLDRRGGMYDLISAAPQSTEFAISRFFAPMLIHSGWSLFVDCDVVFLRDPLELLERYADDTKAVMVVKHPVMNVSGTKMDGQQQLPYRRKLWSSVMLINADHPANLRLNLTTVNQVPGRDLHAFCWLADDEIGELPREWNWLVDIADKPDNPGLAHFTLGTPNLPGVKYSEHAKVWFDAQRS
jgi:lipopolysaccharide biosynthesis glycosyltransferase